MKNFKSRKFILTILIILVGVLLGIFGKEIDWPIIVIILWPYTSYIYMEGKLDLTAIKSVNIKNKTITLDQEGKT